MINSCEGSQNQIRTNKSYAKTEHCSQHQRKDHSYLICDGILLRIILLGHPSAATEQSSW